MNCNFCYIGQTVKVFNNCKETHFDKRIHSEMFIKNHVHTDDVKLDTGNLNKAYVLLVHLFLTLFSISLVYCVLLLSEKNRRAASKVQLL